MVNISELCQLQQLPNEVIPAVARNAEEVKVETGSCRGTVSVHQNALLWFTRARGSKTEVLATASASAQGCFINRIVLGD